MLTRLSLTDFRNHGALMLEPGAPFVVLTGENGAGKTNVLEAISLLAPGRGLRRASLSDVARQGGPGGFAVAAQWQAAGDAAPVSLGTGAMADAPERRVSRVNGAPAPASALAEWMSVLWLTPAMDRLFMEPASERRRFLDRLTLALAPRHGTHVTRYEAAMRERNRLLSDLGTADPAWLDALEARMAEHGAAMAAARRDTVAALAGPLADPVDPAFPAAALSLASEAPEELAPALRRSRARDAAAGRTLTGPHRDDLNVTHLAKDQAAALCSTGEQKALLLGLVLAHARLVADRTGRAPVMLLDEVAAHLDPRRRAALFATLAGMGQVWMTGTEAAPFEALEGQADWFRIGTSL